MNIGDVIRGKYRLVRLLGDGGMGSVYEATHELLGTRVAIKVLHADLARRPGLVERFLQEARVAAQIKSPHVVHVGDVDRTEDGTAYIVMELLEGEPLSATLDRQGKLPIATACDYVKQILEALEAAHALGVVHRDLKPENVFVTFHAAKPVLKLIDFGIAKLRGVTGGKSLTVAGVVMGTAEYMAPEQARSADTADARSDIYAVGVMLYEMIAGRRPVAGEDARVIALKVERGEVTPLVHAAPEVPREIAGLVHRAMAASPALRFAGASEMRLALEGALSGKRVPTAQVPQRFEGSSTVQAAPVAAAFVPAAYDAPPRTERTGPAPNAFGAPPAMGTAYAAHGPPGTGPGQSAYAPHAPPGTSPRRKGRATWAFIVLPLLLGAGVVAALIFGSTTPSSEGPGLVLTPTPTATLTAATPTATQTAPPLSPVATLVPPAHATPPAPHTSSDGGHAPPLPSGTGPVVVPPFPSGLPSAFPFPIPFPGDGGIPQGFPNPFPSGFPTSFPSSFPTALPSTLPFQFPPAPSSAPAPPPTPGAPPTPSGTL